MPGERPVGGVGVNISTEQPGPGVTPGHRQSAPVVSQFVIEHVLLQSATTRASVMEIKVVDDE